jgi:hypothetical protein
VLKIFWCKPSCCRPKLFLSPRAFFYCRPERSFFVAPSLLLLSPRAVFFVAPSLLLLSPRAVFFCRPEPSFIVAPCGLFCRPEPSFIVAPSASEGSLGTGMPRQDKVEGDAVQNKVRDASLRSAGQSGAWGPRYHLA